MIDQEMIDMADMYANVCTRQEEKFTTWIRWGCPWRWPDCEAAWDLVKNTDPYMPYRDGTRRSWGVESHKLFDALSAYYEWQRSEAFLWEITH